MNNEIEKIFDRAYNEGRNFLYEFEVYDVLQNLGLKTLKYIYIPYKEEIDLKLLEKTFSGNVVIKVVSGGITHKTEAGGVKTGVKIQEVDKIINKMKSTIPEKYSTWIKNNSDIAPSRYKKYIKNSDSLKRSIQNDISGFLIVEELKYKPELGNELLIGIKYDQSFGPVILFGIGGIRADFYIENFKENCSFIMCSPFISGKKYFKNSFKTLPVYKILSGESRGEKRIIENEKIEKLILSFYSLAKSYTIINKTSNWNIIEAEVNPYVISNKELLPLDGLLKFEKVQFN
ncbi:hypothetical protein DRQ09_10530, partial [candidate division KSB1 bacterium]